MESGLRIDLLSDTSSQAPPIQPASLRRFNDRLACHHSIRDHDFVVFLGLHDDVTEREVFDFGIRNNMLSLAFGHVQGEQMSTGMYTAQL
jgi:hypothetical protein